MKDNKILKAFTFITVMLLCLIIRTEVEVDGYNPIANAKYKESFKIQLNENIVSEKKKLPEYTSPTQTAEKFLEKAETYIRNKKLEEEARERIARDMAAFAEKKRREEAERQKLAALEKAKQISNRNINRGNLNYSRTVTILATYYTSLPEENSGYTCTATGKQLQDGMIATAGDFSMGTVLISDDMGVQVVEDKMYSGAYKRCVNGEIPVDVFVPQQYGESTYSYKQRVYNMGVKTYTAKVYTPQQ